MAIKDQITPKRLREIIDLLAAAETFADIKAVKDSLTANENEDYEAYTQNLPGHVEPAKETTKTTKTTTTKKKEATKSDLTITRTPYPKWWKDSLNAKIALTAPGSAILATVSGKLRLFVATIVITVTGETVITINFGNAGSSGPIYLGGEGQPMGFVAAMGNSPAPCGDGSLSISATDPSLLTPSIGGWATCFVEEYTQK